MRKFAKKIFNLFLHHPKGACIAAILFGGLFSVQASFLSLKSDFTDLLPDHFESVKSLRKLEGLTSGIGFVTVIFEGPDVEGLKREAKRFAEEMEKNASVRYVEYQKPSRFFYEHRYLFLDLEKLGDIYHKLEGAVKIRTTGAVDQALHSIRNLLGEKQDHAAKYDHFYADPDLKIVAVLVRPTFESNEMDKSAKLLDEIKMTIEHLQLPPPIQTHFTGRYVKKLELANHISGEIKKVSFLALFLIGFLILVSFRRVASLLLFVPLTFSLALTFGLTYWMIGSLNVISGFTASILSGLGIDYAFYLTDHYLKKRDAGLNPQEAAWSGFLTMGPALTQAFLTTWVAFIMLLFSRFKGFSEFGLIGLVGLLIAFLVMVFLLPALFVLFDRVLILKPWWNFSLPSISKWQPSHWPSARWGLVIFFLLLTIVLWQRGFYKLDYDVHKLEASNLPSYQWEAKSDPLFETSLTPAVALAKDLAEEVELTHTLEKIIERRDPEVILEVKSLSNSVPGDQKAKRDILIKTLEIVEKLPHDALKGWESEVAGLVTAVLRTELTPENLPPPIRRYFLAGDEKNPRRLLHIFTDTNESDITSIRRLADAFHKIRSQYGIEAISEALILNDIARLIETGGTYILIATFLLIALLTHVHTRTYKDTARCLLVFLAGGLAALVGLRLFHIRWNLLNVSVIPIILGIGIDNVTHLYSKWVASGKDRLTAIRNTFMPMTLACTTSMIGFGCLILADHYGLYSVGMSAMIGIFSMYLMSLLLFPVLFRN